MNLIFLFSTLFLFVILCTLSIIDVRKQIINIKILLSAQFYILFIHPISQKIFFKEDLFANFIERITASSVTLISLLIVSILVSKIISKEALGHGDILLASMGSAWIGISGIFIALGFAFLLAGLKDFARMIFQQKIQPTPFAPYLSLSIFGVWILGDELIDMLLNMFF